MFRQIRPEITVPRCAVLQGVAPVFDAEVAPCRFVVRLSYVSDREIPGSLGRMEESVMIHGPPGPASGLEGAGRDAVARGWFRSTWHRLRGAPHGHHPCVRCPHPGPEAKFKPSP